MPKIISLMLSLLLPLLLLSCAHNFPDKPICVELNPTRGGCVTMISNQRFLVDDDHLFEGKSWWELRPYLIQIPASTWEAIKAFIIKLCKDSNKCQKSVTNWERAITDIDAQILQKELPSETGDQQDQSIFSEHQDKD